MNTSHLAYNGKTKMLHSRRASTTFGVSSDYTWCGIDVKQTNSPFYTPPEKTAQRAKDDGRCCKRCFGK